jgi:predicted nucleic acid-binding protein
MPARRLTDLPAGREVLIDANVLIYGLTKRSPECDALLRRCAVQDVLGFTTVEIVNDVCHRLMLAEAMGKGFIPKQNAAALKAKTSVVSGLRDYWARTSSIPLMNILALPLDEHRLQRAHLIRQRHPLLTTDSVIAAGANLFGIEALATNDADFDVVPWLAVYKPGDVV